MEYLIIILFCVVGYMVGAIPTGYFFSKYFFGIDITQYGSGNIGASNVARVLGRKYFVLIALIDALKAYGVLAVSQFLAGHYDLPAWSLYVVVVSLLIGNAYSVFLAFKGGKGVATALGIMLYVLPLLAVGLFVASWGVCLTLTKQPFIASLISMLLVLSYLAAYGSCEQVLLVSMIAVWLLFRHQTNIAVYLKKFNF